jgi:hypothetical protein
VQGPTLRRQDASLLRERERVHIEQRIATLQSQFFADTPEESIVLRAWEQRSLHSLSDAALSERASVFGPRHSESDVCIAAWKLMQFQALLTM